MKMMKSVKEIQDSKKNKKTSKLTTYFLEHPIMKYIYDFLFLVIIYGFLLNVSLRTFYVSLFKLSITNTIGLGITFYFFKEELPLIIRGCLPYRKK